MMLEWIIEGNDAVSGDYRVIGEPTRYVVMFAGKILGWSTNPEKAQEMAERHAKTGVAYPIIRQPIPRRR
jgi:hypothetical protein